MKPTTFLNKIELLSGTPLSLITFIDKHGDEITYDLISKSHEMLEHYEYFAKRYTSKMQVKLTNLIDLWVTITHLRN
jgi:hypothetical protein